MNLTGMCTTCGTIVKISTPEPFIVDAKQIDCLACDDVIKLEITNESAGTAETETNGGLLVEDGLNVSSGNGSV